MWMLFQLAVFFGVMFTGIHYKWTPNGYVLTLIGLGAAFLSTLGLSELLLLLKRKSLLIKKRR